MARFWLVVLAIVAQTALACAIWLTVDRLAEQRTRRLAAERVALVAETLETTIDRFKAIPALVSEGRIVADALRSPDDPRAIERANAFLLQSANEARLQSLYILDPAGTAIASSNWQESASFVGHNYAFRPYFPQAITSGRGSYYGVGVTTGEAGYFLSARADAGGGAQDGPIGVVVAKVDFSALERLWASSGENVMVSDQDGIIFLASRQAIKFRTLTPLSPGRKNEIVVEQRYATLQIGTSLQDGDMREGAWASHPVAGAPWTISVVIPWTGRGWVPALMVLLEIFTVTIIGLAVLGWRQRAARKAVIKAAYAELEQRVEVRTGELALALRQLESEIADRQRIDTDLHRARDQLVQAAKLAAMGRAFSGLAHEINQPLAALRTYIASTRLLIESNEKAQSVANLEVMEGALLRMAVLTGDLRRLSRRSDEKIEIVDLAEIALQVATLLKFRLSDAGASLEVEAHGPVLVRGNGNRLEQVVLNLVMNALDAVAGSDDPAIRLVADMYDSTARLSVSDRGDGVPEAKRGQVFEPFFTTKEDGVGLGLAISYAIVAEHGGALEYRRTPSGETVFSMSLPLAEREQEETLTTRQGQDIHGAGAGTASGC